MKKCNKLTSVLLICAVVFANVNNANAEIIAATYGDEVKKDRAMSGARPEVTKKMSSQVVEAEEKKDANMGSSADKTAVAKISDRDLASFDGVVSNYVLKDRAVKNIIENGTSVVVRVEGVDVAVKDTRSMAAFLSGNGNTVSLGNIFNFLGDCNSKKTCLFDKKDILTIITMYLTVVGKLKSGVGANIDYSSVEDFKRSMENTGAAEVFATDLNFQYNQIISSIKKCESFVTGVREPIEGALDIFKHDQVSLLVEPMCEIIKNIYGSGSIRDINRVNSEQAGAKKFSFKMLLSLLGTIDSKHKEGIFSSIQWLYESGLFVLDAAVHQAANFGYKNFSAFLSDLYTVVSSVNAAGEIGCKSVGNISIGEGFAVSKFLGGKNSGVVVNCTTTGDDGVFKAFHFFVKSSDSSQSIRRLIKGVDVNTYDVQVRDVLAMLEDGANSTKVNEVKRNLFFKLFNRRCDEIGNGVNFHNSEEVFLLFKVAVKGLLEGKTEMNMDAMFADTLREILKILFTTFDMRASGLFNEFSILLDCLDIDSEGFKKLFVKFVEKKEFCVQSMGNGLGMRLWLYDRRIELFNGTSYFNRFALGSVGGAMQNAFVVTVVDTPDEYRKKLADYVDDSVTKEADIRAYMQDFVGMQSFASGKHYGPYAAGYFMDKISVTQNFGGQVFAELLTDYLGCIKKSLSGSGDLKVFLRDILGGAGKGASWTTHVDKAKFFSEITKLLGVHKRHEYCEGFVVLNPVFKADVEKKMFEKIEKRQGKDLVEKAIRHNESKNFEFSLGELAQLSGTELDSRFTGNVLEQDMLL